MTPGSPMRSCVFSSTSDSVGVNRTDLSRTANAAAVLTTDCLPTRVFGRVREERIREVESERSDLVPKLEATQQRFRNRALAAEDTEDRSGDGTGAVAVPGVIHREANTMHEVSCDERAIERDAERLFGYPPATESLDRGRARTVPSLGQS